MSNDKKTVDFVKYKENKNFWDNELKKIQLDIKEKEKDPLVKNNRQNIKEFVCHELVSFSVERNKITLYFAGDSDYDTLEVTADLDGNLVTEIKSPSV
ncbi:hypothetical protein [Litchfieldia alkalitelluris]|uniref:hypothetical protein n=1 Tax=Litchfieldia alkalitelluris TaxID=304268 RepID=UPI000997FBD0|nr:hypothetical protein [Litchfieldia alkalitelluris]